MHDEPDRHQIVVEMIEKRAAAGRIVERPAEGVLDQTGLVLVRRDLPQLLEADAVFLRLAAGVETEARDQLLGQGAARALGEQGVLRAQLHAAGEAVLGLAVLADPHVAGGDTDDRAVLVVEHLGGREARIDFDPERFGLGGEPAADIAERDDEVAVVVHQRRHQEIRQPYRAGRPQQIEPVRRSPAVGSACPRRATRATAGRGRSGRSPRRTEYALPPRSPSRPRPPDASGDELLEPDRGGKPAGPAPTITTSNSIASRAGTSVSPMKPPDQRLSAQLLHQARRA